MGKPETELEKYCINLNKKANEDDIDCLIGRHEEIQRTVEILCRRKKNNALLVGESGVGKTAIAEGLAVRIVKGDVPDILKDAVIYSLDIGSLVAGTKFRGDFEERIKLMLEALKKLKNAILFIDEIHSIIGAGSTTSGALDASNLLKPALANGGLRCIGATTFKEYRNNFEKDMALVRRFQKVVVEEPSEEVTPKILNGLKGYYEKHHKVTYTESALKAAITLSERYINERHLPDKAIDLID
jgi:ATP-dependent Clp protease ATP-binding subunit ClpA